MTAAIAGQDWRARAACAGADPRLFFGPDGELSADRERRELEAKRICAACPVRTPCLAWGESQSEAVRRLGVYGGLGEQDRQALRRYRGQMRRRAA